MGVGPGAADAESVGAGVSAGARFGDGGIAIGGDDGAGVVATGARSGLGAGEAGGVVVAIGREVGSLLGHICHASSPPSTIMIAAAPPRIAAIGTPRLAAGVDMPGADCAAAVAASVASPTVPSTRR